MGKMLIGIDDTDSLEGMCTTYIAKKICGKIKIVGYPRLVRLNPNIPFKTRGNGAIALEARGESEKIKKITIEIIKKFSMAGDKRTNPGAVFVEETEKNRKILSSFYKKAVSELVSIKQAEDLAKKVNADIFKMKNGRGIIGALAALGFDGKKKTYELVSYRVPGNYGKKRLIDEDSVWQMNVKMYPNVFDSVDEETKRILITPRGKDPVFCGIRGKSLEYVMKAWGMIRPLERIESTLVYETNQGTDEHYKIKKVVEIKPYDCVQVEGTVSSTPKVIEGGHVVFSISDLTGCIDCAAYQQTGQLKNMALKVGQGDRLVVCGGIGKYVKTLNIEKMYVKDLAECTIPVVPNCCGKKMTSDGKNKGFKCRKCHKKVSQVEIKSQIQSRAMKKGWYEAPPRARRHLCRPLALY